METMKWDHEGYAVYYEVEQPDGRIIHKDGFKGSDGKDVPLVYRKPDKEYMHPTYLYHGSVIGLAHLENREDGVYAYCKFFEEGFDKQIVGMNVYAYLYNHNGKEIYDAVIKAVILQAE